MDINLNDIKKEEDVNRYVVFLNIHRIKRKLNINKTLKNIKSKSNQNKNNKTVIKTVENFKSVARGAWSIKY
jgi:hypothetical protein